MSDSIGYVHFIPPVKERPEYPACLDHNLVKTIDDLKEALSNRSNYIAWDTETSSLDPEQGFIVGYSFSFDGKKGYYVPVNHISFGLGKVALDLFYERLLKVKKSFVYNMRFDYRFMEYSGYDMSNIPYYDVSIGCWLSDTNVKMPSLKDMERHFLGWDPKTFEETLGNNINFYHLDPEDCYIYASTDALGTFCLASETIKYYKESKISGVADNDSLFPLMRFENKPLPIDKDYLERCQSKAFSDLKDMELEIYSMIGYPININSNKQLGEALQSLGINTGKFTKTGLMKVDIPTLETVNLENPHPILKLLIEYSKLFKVNNSYIEPLLEECKKKDNRLRFSYITNNVPCLTESAIVCIKGKGLVSIKEANSGDFIWTQYGWRKILWNNSHYSGDIYKVRFSNGLFLEGTGHHPVLVNLGDSNDKTEFEWSALKALTSNDSVCLNHRTISDFNFNISNKPFLSEVCKFVASIFDSYGGFSDGKVVFSGLESFSNIQMMLIFIGINSFLLDNSLVISDSMGISYFRDLVTPYIKESKYKEELEKYFSWFYTGNLTKVVSVDQYPGDIVYDIEVEDVHEYIANGIVTHNTGRLSCGADKKNTFFAKINEQCVVGDTKVFTDKGICDIKDIDVGNYVWDGDSFNKVLNKFNNGVRGVYEVRLSNGESIRCTDRHQFYSFTDKIGFKELNSLKVGDKVAVNSKSILMHSDHSVVEDREELWEALGHFVAEGCFGEGFELKFYFSSNEVFVRIRDNLINLGMPFVVGRGKNEECRDEMSVVVNSVEFFNLINNLGFKMEEKNKFIPNKVFMLSVENRRAFIRGLLLSNKDYVQSGLQELKTSFKFLAKDLCLLLSSLGMIYSYHEFLNYYQVDLLEDMGSYKIEGCINDYDSSKYWVLIESIQYIGEEEVYDIHVENSNRYIANGILVHNSIPKPHPIDWFVHPYKEGDKVNTGDVVIQNYRFSLVDKSDYIIEGFNPEMNLRNAFIAEEGTYWVSMDYSAEELRVIANVSNETKWIETFLSGGDLHKQQAINMWGIENYNKEKRKRAKVLNFGMSYGMSGYSLAEKFHVSIEEGEDIVKRFWKACPNIKAFQNACVRKARKEGTIYNYFGRPRRVRYWLSSDDSKKRAFGVRTVGNSIIQSVGADVLKISMIKSWKKIYNNDNWRNKSTGEMDVRFMSTVHDEINSCVVKSRLEEFVREMQSCMEMKNLPGWKVPLITGIEIGNKFGCTFPHHWEDGHLVPDMRKIEE